MSLLQEIDAELAALERELAAVAIAPDQAQRLRGRVAQLRRRLEGPEAVWVGTTEAKRLLGLKTEHTVKAWARAGLLRSRVLANGRVQVHLDDVRRRAAERETLRTPWDGALTDEELDVLAATRPGPPPWARRPGGGRGG
jgi:hypothetical protein